jgi:hypothetical protein
MTGTPVLAKPVEIYNLIKILRPDVCPEFQDFAERYSNPQQGRRKTYYTGARCT